MFEITVDTISQMKVRKHFKIKSQERCSEARKRIKSFNEPLIINRRKNRRSIYVRNASFNLRRVRWKESHTKPAYNFCLRTATELAVKRGNGSC